MHQRYQFSSFSTTCTKKRLGKQHSCPGGNTVVTFQITQESHIFESKCQRKTRHTQKSNRHPYARSGRRQDVMARRAEGAVFRGNLMARAQYSNHSEQAFRLEAHEEGTLAQNYLLAYLFKGGIPAYVYICLYSVEAKFMPRVLHATRNSCQS